LIYAGGEGRIREGTTSDRPANPSGPYERIDLEGDDPLEAGMETRRRVRVLSVAAAVSFAAVIMVFGYLRIGLPPVVIVGGSSVAAMVMWIRTYLRRPVDPSVILPPFLLTVAALEAHMIEEYMSGFGPAMSRLFDISWTERSFLMVFAFLGPILYTLTALGLYYRVPLAGFLAWFIFIGPGVAEITHFIFPLLKPAILPELAQTISQQVSNGRFVAGMRNYWIRTTGVYYFPGLYTAILPMVPGIIGIRRVIRASRRSEVRAN
jgi:hypothetical protein